MRTSAQEMPVAFEAGGSVGRVAEMGDFMASFQTIPARDYTPLFKGLPGDRCTARHWGYLLRGRMRVQYADREEVVNAGDAYYLEPGHIPVFEEETEVIEFTPKGDMTPEYMATVGRNFAAMFPEQGQRATEALRNLVGTPPQQGQG